jgi:asparagine synthetase B (glutamine-hydrolysing)
MLFSRLSVHAGADEQLGGYGRHLVNWKTNGWKGLAEEIHMDVNRISSRNLGTLT